MAKSKTVIVFEMGLPSADNIICNAVAFPANASFYFLNFASGARANNISYFYFTGLDEAWKTNHEGPQGAYWGVWDEDNVEIYIDANNDKPRIYGQFVTSNL